MNFPLHLQSFILSGQAIELFAPDPLFVRQAYESGAISFPYWSKVWPAAIALSEFILQEPQHIKNKEVIELGAGLGLPSLVAARYATHVLCTDASAEAIGVVKQSVKHLGLQNITAAVLDWKELKNCGADVLLLSDVNYEPESFTVLKKIIEMFLQKGALVLLSTPQRLVAKAFVEPLLNACVYTAQQTVTLEADKACVTVMSLQKQDEKMDERIL